jgi:hypothetical protein
MSTQKRLPSISIQQADHGNPQSMSEAFWFSTEIIDWQKGATRQANERNRGEYATTARLKRQAKNDMKNFKEKHG